MFNHQETTWEYLSTRIQDLKLKNKKTSLFQLSWRLFHKVPFSGYHVILCRGLSLLSPPTLLSLFLHISFSFLSHFTFQILFGYSLS